MKIPKYNFILASMEILAGILMLWMLFFTALEWNHLPEQIPTHFNYAGAIDGWGSKKTLLLLPGIALALWITMTAVSFFPKLWNIPIKITPANQDRVYELTFSFLVMIKIEVLVLLAYLIFHTVKGTPLHNHASVVIIAVLFGTVLGYVLKLLRVRKNK